ncbi:MAG: PEP-CTERM sorting domain-containing protein [Limisphaerales bacterium]
MNSFRHPSFCFALVLAATSAGLPAAAVSVPNHSFEAPVVPQGFPALTIFDSWQKAPAPDGFPADQWANLSGMFPNAPVGDPRHLQNADGNQVAFLFPVPGVAVSQELGSLFEVGLSYDLRIGLRGGGALTPGATFQISLFYNAGGSPVTVASTQVSATADYVTTPVLFEIGAQSPVVQAGDAWAGKNIGVRLLATSANGAPGTAYWEADNVRVTAVPEPGTLTLLGLGAAGGWLWRRRRA